MLTAAQGYVLIGLVIGVAAGFSVFVVRAFWWIMRGGVWPR